MHTYHAQCGLLAIGLLLTSTTGCTRESVRIALETQRRADQVQQGIFDRQHEALRILLFRDLAQRLEAGHAPLSDAQRQALSTAWNERDLIEFWGMQQERTRALRLVGVDMKLWADQSIVDLLMKQLDRRAARVSAAVATHLGEQLTSDVPVVTGETPGGGASQ